MQDKFFRKGEYNYWLKIYFIVAFKYWSGLFAVGYRREVAASAGWKAADTVEEHFGIFVIYCVYNAELDR